MTTPSSSLMADMFVGTLVIDNDTKTIVLKCEHSGLQVPLSFGDVLTAKNWRVTTMPGQYREALVQQGNAMGNMISMPNDERLFLTSLPVPEHQLPLILTAVAEQERVTLELENPMLKDASLGTLGRLMTQSTETSGDINWRLFAPSDDSTPVRIKLGDTLTLLTHQGAEVATITVDFMMLRGMGAGFKNLPNYQSELASIYEAFRDGCPVILKTAS